MGREGEAGIWEIPGAMLLGARVVVLPAERESRPHERFRGRETMSSHKPH